MRSVLTILAVTALVFVLGVALVALLPTETRRQSSYLMAVPDNIDRLAQHADAPQRIILLGGSSMGWGLSAAQIERDLGITTLNLGVHAGIGYENIWTLYEDHLNPETDIIVVSPEYSMVRSGTGLTRTYCDVLYLTRTVSLDGLACGAKNAFTSLRDLVYPPREDATSLYQRAGFNAYGDYTLAYDLPNQGGFASGEILDLERDASAIAQYQSFLRARIDMGFRVIFIPTTLAQESCIGAEAEYFAVNAALADGLPIHFDETFPFCAPDPLFVNTSYHPNREGMNRKTRAALQIIRAELDR